MRFPVDAALVGFRKETAPRASATVLHVLLKLFLSRRHLLNYSTFFPKLSMIRGKNIPQISFLVTLLSAYGPDTAWAFYLKSWQTIQILVAGSRSLCGASAPLAEGLYKMTPF